MAERVELIKLCYGDKVLLDFSPKRKNWDRFCIVVDLTLIALLSYQIYQSV